MDILGRDMDFHGIRSWLLMGGAALALAGCQSGNGSAALDGAAGSIAGGAISSAPLDGEAISTEGAETAGAPASRSVMIVDRDVEAPEVFSVTDEALWDGRPSLGGVWVASAEAVDPERVILRNPANGKFVIGALFRRERDNPGPPLQISSDAAEALGLLAGQPGMINVTALRRQEGPVAQPPAAAPILDEAETVQPQSEAAEIAASAAAAIGAASDPAIPTAPPAEAPQSAEGQPEAEGAVVLSTVPTAQPAPDAPAKPAASGGGSLIQIGIFSIEANARRAVEMLAKAGIAASISAETSQGKTFWSVSARGDKSVLAAIRKAGFADAYLLKS